MKLKMSSDDEGALSAINSFYNKRTEPNKSCLLALRAHILNYNEHINEKWKYSLPFFYYKNKMFCYFWLDKKTRLPYIGIVEGGRIDHPALEQGNRKRMKIMSINPYKDLPIKDIDEVFNEAIKFYK